MSTMSQRHPAPGPPQRPGPQRPDPYRPGAQPLAPATGGIHAVPGPGRDTVLDRLLDHRIVFLDGELDDAAAGRIVAQLLLLAAKDPRRDITLHLNSTGGPAPAGLAVHDAMQLVAPDVATWAAGLVAATGQLLLSAGAAGKRHALPHARILLCRPSAGMRGGASDVAVRGGVLGQLRAEMAELTARATGRPLAEVEADADAGRWFTAPQARDYGLVDHVAG